MLVPRRRSRDMLQQPRDQFEVRGIIARERLTRSTGSLFDSAENHRGLAVGDPGALTCDFLKHRFHFSGQALRRERLGRVLVDHPARRRFERGRECRRRLRHVIVVETHESLGLVTGNPRVKQEEELMLALTETRDARKQRR